MEQVRQMAELLLSNPVIEDYEVRVVESDTPA
jgi:phosphoribosylformylglycinamidine (FGAM) synthase PurS component